MSSMPRRLAVLAVATTLAAAASTAQAAPSQSSPPAQPSAHWVVVVPETAAVRPPASATALARDLGVDTDFAWKTLDELVRNSRPDRSRSRSILAPGSGASLTRPSGK
jgi:hypothetical protein